MLPVRLFLFTVVCSWYDPLRLSTCEFRYLFAFAGVEGSYGGAIQQLSYYKNIRIRSILGAITIMLWDFEYRHYVKLKQYDCNVVLGFGALQFRT